MVATTNGQVVVDPILETFSRSADGVFAVDREYRVILWNRGAESLLGYPASEVLGKRCYELIAGRDKDSAPFCRLGCPTMSQARLGHGVRHYDLSTRNRAGCQVWIGTSVFPVSSEGRSATALVHVFHDATPQRRLERFVQQTGAVARKLTETNGSVFELLPFQADVEVEAEMEYLEELTPRQREVLWLLAQGQDTNGVAEHLLVSQATARNHIQAVLSKLGARSRLEAVAYARRHGLL